MRLAHDWQRGMRRILRYTLMARVTLSEFIFLKKRNLFASRPDDKPIVLAHRDIA